MHVYATAPDGSPQVRDLEITEEQEKLYVEKMFREIESTKRKRGKREKSWKKSVQAYRSRMMEEEIKDTERAAVDIPIIKTMSQQTEARLVNPLLQHDPIHVVKPRTAEMKEFARVCEETIDYLTDKLSWRDFLTKAARVAMVFSKVVVHIGYEVEERQVKQWEEVEQPVVGEDGTPIPTLSPGGEPTGTYLMEKVLQEKEFTVTDWQGARPRIVPTERFYHPIPLESLKSSPWVMEECYLSPYDIRAYEKRGIYREGTMAKLKSAEKKGPDEDFALSGPSRDKSESDESDSDAGTIRIYEVYTTLSFLDPKQDDIEVVLTFEPESKTVCRAVYNWYHEYQRGFLKWSYEDVPNDIDGISLAYQLEPIHRAISASVNQRLDAASKALGKTLFASTDGDLSEKCRNGTIPEGLVEVDSLSDASKQFFEWSPSQSFNQMESLEQFIQQFGEKLAALNLSNFGIEQIQRPTATGTVSLLEEGKQPLFQLLESFREFDADVVKVMLARYRQFAPAGIETYVETSPEGELALQILQWPEGYWQNDVIIETAVSSEKMSKMVRRQEIMGWLDKFPQVISTYMDLASAATTPEPIAKVAEELLVQFYETFKEMLREFDMDTRKAVDPRGAVNAGRTWGQAKMEYEQALQQLQQMSEQQQQTIEEQGKQLESLARRACSQGMGPGFGQGTGAGGGRGMG